MHANVNDEIGPHHALEFGFQVFAAKSKSKSLDNEPRTLAEAMRRPDKDKWFDCAYKEIQALIDNGTWELTTVTTWSQGNWLSMGISHQAQSRWHH